MTDTPDPDTNSHPRCPNQSGERQVCAVCGRILNTYASPTGETAWLHTFADQPEDHPAVPVHLDAGIIARPRCVFCSAEDPAWELPVRSFVIPGPTLGPVGNGSHGNWAACDHCADLIRSNQWTALRHRALAAWSDAAAGGDTGSRHDRIDGTGVDQRLGRLYRLLRRNITGPQRQSAPPSRPDRRPDS